MRAETRPKRPISFCSIRAGIEYWGSPEYFGEYPCIDDEVLDFILAGDYKGIGFDVIGLDPIADENLTRHKRLFAHRAIVNIENLTNLDACGRGLFDFSCFPLPLKDGRRLSRSSGGVVLLIGGVWAYRVLKLKLSAVCINGGLLLALVLFPLPTIINI